MSIVTKAFAFTLAAGLIIPVSKAQDTKDKVQKDQTIIIRQKGNSKEKLKIEVDGDNVTVNGKPLSEYKGEDIQVMKSRRPGDVEGLLALTAPRSPRPPRVQALPRMNMAPMEGLDGIPFPDENRAFLGVTTEQTDGGVKVTGVSKGSAAEKAGLKKDDIITMIGSTRVETSEALYDAVSKYKPEEKVAVSYKRDGKESTVNAVLGNNKNMLFEKLRIAPQAFEFNNDFNNNFVFHGRPRLGLQVQETDNNSGLKILDIDEESPAAKAGLKSNDIITSVNGKDVNKLEDIRTLTKDIKEGDAIKVTYKRDNRTETTEIKFPKRLKKADL